MPKMLRSTKLYIQHGVELPMSPSVAVEGKGKDGKIVCKLYINATGISVHGPKDALIRDIGWDDLIEIVRPK